MQQKGFKEILPKEPTCGLKGLSWVRYRSVMGPNNLPTILFWKITKLYYLLLIIN